MERQYGEARCEARIELSGEDRKRIRELARDLPAVWNAPTTCTADRKAMLRLVIEVIAVHPVEVPRRSTRIRVQWRSGAVTELEIARPGKGQYRTHGPAAVQRIRELAAAGLHDDEIADRLEKEDLRTGSDLPWKEDLVRAVRRKNGIARVAKDRPRMHPLPNQHPDGRYSVPGAAVRFGVSRAVVRAWIKQGLVVSSRADFGTHRNVCWLHIDEATVSRLGRRRRSNRKARKAR